MKYDRSGDAAGRAPVVHSGVLGLRRKLLAVLIAACYGSAYGNPVGPQVAAGQASFSQQGKLFSITNTPNTILNWQSFSIGADEVTRFLQQSADSKVLNRITGQDPSQILGALQSNGKVFLINPNGVLFGQGSRIDVNGLVASSLALSDSDFLAGKNNFSAAATAGKVSNQGTITTPGGGQVYLIAPSVDNGGVITAPNGDIVLAAGRSVQLVDSSDPDLRVVVSAPADQAINLGRIVAQGGRVGIYGALVNQRGHINADSAAIGEHGQIILKASGTALLEAGSVTSATGVAPGGGGGSVQLLGARVGMTGDARIDVSGDTGGGTVLLGGDYHGGNPAVPNAQQSYVGADSVIVADALTRGDGGKVVVWSDDATRMYGHISARGGALGGNGGQVETSGHYLDMQGTVDARAPRGQAGQLLLDPSDVYIATDVTAANGAGMLGINLLPVVGDVFLETASYVDSLLTTSTLSTALGLANVTVSTANSNGLGTGLIKVVNPLGWTSSKGLTLSAASDITLGAAITATSGTLSLSSSGGNISQSAAFSLAKLSATASGGSITLNSSNQISGTAALSASAGASLTASSLNMGTVAVGGGLALTSSSGALALNGNVSAGAGITLSSAGSVSIGSAVQVADSGGPFAITSSGATSIGSSSQITTGGAAMSVSATQFSSGSGSQISTSNGALTISADQMTLAGTISAGSGAITLAPVSSSVNVKLGSGATDASGTLGLNDTELQQVNTSSLLTVGVTDSNSSASVTVVGNLNLSSSLSGDLLLQAQKGALSVNSGATLTTNHVLSLQTNPLGNYSFTNSGTVVSNEGVNIFAGTMSLKSGHLTAPSVGLSTDNDINLGSSSAINNTLVLSSADLASVSGALSVSINSYNSGGVITISQPLTLSGDLELDTLGSIAVPAALSVGGVLRIDGGSWSQIAGTLPALTAHDFQLGSAVTFLRTQGGDGSSGSPYQIADVYGLQGLSTLALSNAYLLTSNIAASGTTNWNDGQGFRPIGNISNPYNGTFNGNSKTISGLVINLGADTGVGLFSYLGSGTIMNLNLSGGDIYGQESVGGLVGYASSSYGSIQNVQSSAHVRGTFNVGGVAGTSYASVSGASASGSIDGYAGSNASNVGGVVGRNLGVVTLSSSTATVDTSGYGYTGDLVGSNLGSVSLSSASGNVFASGEIIGGLVGDNLGGSISQSYASGNVGGGRNVGGLAGRNNGGTISNAYFSGNVYADLNDSSVSHQNMAGLVGDNLSGSICYVFNSGNVNGSGFGAGVKGLIGIAESGTLSHGFYGITASGQSSDAGGGIGLTSAQMLQQSSYSGFDFSSAPVWRIYAGHTTPLLKALLDPLQVTVSGSGSSKVYNGQSASFSGSGSYSGLVGGDTSAVLSGTLGYDGAIHVGSYNVGGLWSTKYDISYSGASAPLVITPRSVTATVSGSKVYDAGTGFSAPLYSFSNKISGDTLSVSGSVSFANKNVGGSKTLTVSSPVLGNNSLGDYVLSGTITGSGSITKAPLTVNGLSVSSKVYDGGTSATLTGTASVTALGSDTVSVAASGSGATFNNKNVGEGKAVSVNAGLFTLSGADAGNYTASAPTGLLGDITPKALTISGLSASDRVYNADTNAVLAGGTLQGVISGDQVSFGGGVAYFGDKNVGSGKPVTMISANLGGSAQGNYYVPVLPTGLNASITPATLTLSGVTAAGITYNAQTATTVSGGALNGVLGSDVVSLDATNAAGNFVNANAGTAKPVTVSGYTLGGTDGGNYLLTMPSGVTADITARALSTWTASGGGLWSDTANWQDGIAPNGANVLAVSFPAASGTVSYSAAAGSTTVKTLSMTAGQSLTVSGGSLTIGTALGDVSAITSGTLNLSGGSLNLIGTLGTDALMQTNGALSGSGHLSAGQFSLSAGSSGVGSMTVDNYSQSGGSVATADLTVGSSFVQQSGTISASGTVAIAQGSGDLQVGAIQAGTAIVLGTASGAITQTGALQTGSLSTVTQNGVTLTNSGNRVNAFGAVNSGAGGIALSNTVPSGQLALGVLSTGSGSISIDNHGGVQTGGTISASTGGVALTAHSPITINNTIDAATIALTASTSITLGSSSNLQASQGISIGAGTDVNLGGVLNVLAGGSISVLASVGNISTAAGTSIDSHGGLVNIAALQGSVNAPLTAFAAGTTATVLDGAAQAAAQAAVANQAATAAQAAADAAAAQAAATKALADAAAAQAAAAQAVATKAAADAAAKAAADAAQAAANQAAAKAAADAAAAKLAADAAAAAKTAADAAAAQAAAAQAAAAQATAAQAAQQGAGSNAPVAVALNSTVTLINSSVAGSAPSSKAASTPLSTPAAATPAAGPAAGGTADTGQSGGSDVDNKDSKKDNKDAVASIDSGVKKDDASKKMYCN